MFSVTYVYVSVNTMTLECLDPGNFIFGMYEVMSKIKVILSISMSQTTQIPQG